MKRAEIFRRTRELEADLQHRNPDWQKRMAAWEDSVRNNQPTWTPVQPDIDDISTGGQKFLRDERWLDARGGYAPTKYTIKIIVKTGPEPVTAVRLELLTDPNLPLGGPGRSPKGSLALTEFEVEAAPADAPEKTDESQDRQSDADVNPREAMLEPIFQDKSGRRRVTGPIEYAIDGNDETAWSIDAGPGTAQPAAQGRLRVRPAPSRFPPARFSPSS